MNGLVPLLSNFVPFIQIQLCMWVWNVSYKANPWKSWNRSLFEALLLGKFLYKNIQICLFPKKKKKNEYHQSNLVSNRSNKWSFFLIKLVKLEWNYFRKYQQNTMPDKAWKMSKYLLRMRQNTDQKKLCIWTLFTQPYLDDYLLINILKPNASQITVW